MNYLQGKKIYLSGPIEYDNSQRNWREAPTQILTERFGLDLFDPFNDPKQQWVPAIKKAQDAQDYNEIVRIAKKFVRKDLSQVDHSHFVIAYLPYKVPTTGTHHEVINSNDRKKPTLLVTDCGDIGKLPTWYFGFISTEFMFPTWDALYIYLDEVNAGLHRKNDRWSLVYGDV